MNIAKKIRRQIFALLLGANLVAIHLSGPVAWADGNPDLVGVLSKITDPANAAELRLTDDQVARLVDIIKQHESQALDFAREIRQLPSADRRIRELESVRAIEDVGLGLLSDEQRAVAEKWRLAMVGPIAMLDPNIASKFGIDPAQSEKFLNILEGRGALVRSMGADGAAREINKRLLEVLTDAQRTQWQEAAGLNVAVSSPAVEAAIASESDSTDEEQGAAGRGFRSRGFPRTGSVQESPSDLDVQPMENVVMSGPEDGLLLNFSAAPWKDVLTWLAKEAELSLQLDQIPQGSFTYRDPYKKYSLTEAMDIMNGLLLGKGFTLMKKQRVLTVLDLDLAPGEAAEIKKALIRDVADLVDVKELDGRGVNEIVKCIFSFERIRVEDIEREIRMLIGPHGSVVPMSTSGQLLVTETGSKLRIIRDMIAKAEDPQGSRGGSIVSLPLNFVAADEVLMTARGLLGIKENEFRGEDISISMDSLGTRLFATGSVEKLQRLRDVVMELDKKPADSMGVSTPPEKPFIRSHSLLGSDPTTTLEVLQTSFAGRPGLNMALDPRSNNIIALANTETHEEMDVIIRELAGQSSEFEIISLDALDPQAAVTTLEKFYGKPAKDADPTKVKGPVFFADVASRRLMVRGTQQEVDQIKTLLNKITDSGPMAEADDGTKFIPLRGKAAQRLLEQIDIMNRASKKNINIKYPKEYESTKPGFAPIQPVRKDNLGGSPVSQVSPASGLGEERAGVEPATFLTSVRLPQDEMLEGDETLVDGLRSGEVITTETGDQVFILQGPTGLIAYSDNPQVMADFNRLLNRVEREMTLAPSEPTIRYLKYIPAAAAAELVKSIIAGEQATGSSGGGLLGDVASGLLGGGGLFGGLFGGGGGSSAPSGVSGVSTSGDVYITPDPRLNAVWVQASPIDILFVEDILDVIDVENSEVENLTKGTPRLIQLANANVADVEPLVKSAFADQIGGQQNARGGAGGGGGQGQPSGQEIIELLRGGGRGGRGGAGGAQSQLKEQTMTVIADKKSNSLITVAPLALHKRVVELVEQLDTFAAEDEEIVVPIALGGDVNPQLLQNAISSVFGSAARTTNASSTAAPAAGGAAGNTTPRFNPAMFQQFQGGGARGAGGANPFGAGGFGAGGFGGAQGGATRGGQGGQINQGNRNTQGGQGIRNNRGGR
ncbi:secretin N-terminal domain-containing protein [Pirellulaceae bacterium SH449]